MSTCFAASVMVAPPASNNEASSCFAVNVNPDVEEIMKSGLNNSDDDFDQRTLIQNREGDVELYKLNLA